MAEESEEIIGIMERNMCFSREFIHDCKEARRSVGLISNEDKEKAREKIIYAIDIAPGDTIRPVGNRLPSTDERREPDL
jgi:hypothetical protein